MLTGEQILDFEPVIRTVARKFPSSRMDLADLTQAAMLRLWEKRDAAPTNLKGWIVTVSRNLFVDLMIREDLERSILHSMAAYAGERQMTSWAQFA